jgi:NAD(P) transhydrogenase subunit beta
MTTPLALSQTAINFTYLVAAVLLIVGIRRLSAPPTARSGNVIAAVGMTIAIVFTFLDPDIDKYWLIAAGMTVGTVVGVASARVVKMTAIPQMVALFNGVGGGAAALVAASEFHRLAPAGGHLAGDDIGAMLFSALIGSISFAGSLVAFAKLQELLPGRPIVFGAQQGANAALFAAVVAFGWCCSSSAPSCSECSSSSPSAAQTCPSSSPC